jgi:hypothetical protein
MVSKRKTSPATTKAGSSRQGRETAVAAGHQEHHKPASLVPVVVEAGSRSRSSLRRLEKGAGPLMHEIGQIVDAIHAVVPGPVSILFIYRESRSSGSRSGSLFGLLPI